MKRKARKYHCGLCHQQVIICSHCDRGQRYCSDHCAQSARKETLRSANQKYQSSPRGRRLNAARQRRFRERQSKKVTDQGSPVFSRCDLLARERGVALATTENSFTAKATSFLCHFCQCACDDFLRLDFFWGRRRD